MKRLSNGRIKTNLTVGEFRELLEESEMKEAFIKEVLTSTVEQVDHPQHYGGDTPYEVIKVMEAWNPAAAYYFCIDSTLKYLGRAGQKEDELVDISKGAWYAVRAEQILRHNPWIKEVTQLIHRLKREHDKG